MERVLQAMSEIHRGAYQLARAATGLMLATALQAGEQHSEEDPPQWARRDEGWTIDGLLGQYDAKARMITIFDKGIAHVAAQMGTAAERLEYVVRLHEWGHAMFHLGVDGETSAALAQASLAGRDAEIRTMDQALTAAYNAVDPYVHEQIAQAITRIALEDVQRGATMDESKAAAAGLIDTFERLMQRQPVQYRIDSHLAADQLARRLRDTIRLIRQKRLMGDRQTWDTIMAW